MKNDLSGLNEAYHSTALVYAGALPSGTYSAKLVNAEVTSSKNNNLQIKWILESETVSGEPGTTMKFSPLIPQCMRFLEADLKTLGIILDDLNELYVVLPKLVGTLILIEVHDDGYTGYHSVNFLKKIADPVI
jgi:hypothetical protein